MIITSSRFLICIYDTCHHQMEFYPEEWIKTDQETNGDLYLGLKDQRERNLAEAIQTSSYSPEAIESSSYSLI